MLRLTPPFAPQQRHREARGSQSAIPVREAGHPSLLAEVPSAGTSTAVVLGGLGAVAVGATFEAGAASNAARILTTPIESRRVGEFSDSTRQQKYDENAAKNGGKNVCEKCGAELAPGKKSQKGVSPPQNERTLDHKKSLSQGGTNDKENAQVLCRKCNREKSDK